MVRSGPERPRRAPDAGARLGSGGEPFAGDRLPAAFAEAVQTGGQPGPGGIELGERAVDLGQERGVPGLVQRGRGPLGVVLVVGERQAPGVLGLLDRRTQGLPLGVRGGGPLVQEGRGVDGQRPISRRSPPRTEVAPVVPSSWARVTAGAGSSSSAGVSILLTNPATSSSEPAASCGRGAISPSTL